MPSIQISYFIHIIEENFIYLHNLLCVLYHERKIYVYHIDAKMEHVVKNKKVKSLLRKTPGVRSRSRTRKILALDSEIVIYGGIIMAMNCIMGRNFLLSPGHSLVSRNFFRCRLSKNWTNRRTNSTRTSERFRSKP